MFNSFVNLESYNTSDNTNKSNDILYQKNTYTKRIRSHKITANPE